LMEIPLLYFIISKFLSQLNNISSQERKKERKNLNARLESTNFKSIELLCMNAENDDTYHCLT